MTMRRLHDRNGRGIETIDGVPGQRVHVRLQHATSGEAFVEFVGLEVIGQLVLPRSAVPQLRAALKRVTKQP